MLPTHRHELSLEGFVDFSAVLPLGEEERSLGSRRFHLIVDHFQSKTRPQDRSYSRPLLLRYTYEYARSEESRDNFLRTFFDSLGIPLGKDDEIEYDAFAVDVYGFADHLMDSFFLPRSLL